MSTHTYAILLVSSQTYREIREKLDNAGYGDQFHHRDSVSPYGEVIDMHGLAIKEERQEESSRCDVVRRDGTVCNATLCVCEKCGAKWCLDHQINPLVCPGCGDRCGRTVSYRVIEVSPSVCWGDKPQIHEEAQ
jgi:hypothetical protein